MTDTPENPVRLPHLRGDGSAFMVDVTAKAPSVREATAVAEVGCSPRVMSALRDGTVPKGDVLAVARVAGIMAAKRTPDLLPLAHRIGVHGCELWLPTGEHLEISGFSRDVVDTTGAGDTHTGVLVSGLMDGLDVVSAARRANAAAAEAVSRIGPASAPRRDEIDALLAGS